jgi:hypothetical protein
MIPLTTVGELRAQIQQAYRQWSVDRDLADRSTHSRIEWPGVGANLLRGFVSMFRLFPGTEFPSAGLSRRYVCASPWERDWRRVGEDIFQALLKFDPTDSSSAPGTGTSRPADILSAR